MDKEQANAAEMTGAAAPEEISGGVKALTRSLQIAFGALIIVIALMLLHYVTFGGYFAVKPQEAVIVFRFGKLRAVYDSDWHWFVPYPVNRFVVVKTSPQFLTVNLNPIGTLETRFAPPVPGVDRYVITAEGSVIHLVWTFSFHVSDPLKFYQRCLTSGDPSKPDDMIYDGKNALGVRGVQTMLENMFKQAAIEVAARYKVGEIYTSDRGKFSDEVGRRFEALLKQADLGLASDAVTLDSVTVPPYTQKAFDEVQVALNRSKTLRSEAEAESLNIRNRGRLAAAGILADARAYRQEVVSSVKSESIYFLSILEEFRKNPATVKMTLFNNAISEALAGQQDKYVIGTSGAQRQLRLMLNPEQVKSQEQTNGEQR